MEKEEGFNGWSNRWTWMVHLWLSNDEYLYRVATRVARDRDEREMADWVDSLVNENHNDILDSGTMVSDMLGYALALVDWREIVEAFAPEEEEEEEEEEEYDDDIEMDVTID